MFQSFDINSDSSTIIKKTDLSLSKFFLSIFIAKKEINFQYGLFPIGWGLLHTCNSAFRGVASWYGGSLEWNTRYWFPTIGDTNIIGTAVLWRVLDGVCAVSIVLNHWPDVSTIWALQDINTMTDLMTISWHIFFMNFHDVICSCWPSTLIRSSC